MHKRYLTFVSFGFSVLTTVSVFFGSSAVGSDPQLPNKPLTQVKSTTIASVVSDSTKLNQDASDAKANKNKISQKKAGTNVQPVTERAVSSDKYPTHKVIATIFWVGEAASGDNAGISNIPTEWDSNSVVRFGGIDDPLKRNAAGLPAAFTPKHNPYYAALPASEFNENGLISGARQKAPWYNGETSQSISIFKGRWLKVTNPVTGKSVYSQWLDTGPSDNPSGAGDYAYVFGGSSVMPTNKFGARAGIDLSPSAANALGFGITQGSKEVIWQFVDSNNVPSGPWKTYPSIDNKTYW